MKKLLIIIFTLFLISCNLKDKNKLWTLKYVVFYPNFNDTITISGHTPYYCSSDRGSNYIKEGSISGPDIYNGSAPYKILYYTVKNLK